jgi:hypothetical protein
MRRPYPDAVASVDVLFEGYLRRPDHRVASTVGLIRDGDAVVVVDPRLVPDPASILDPLAALGLGPSDVTTDLGSLLAPWGTEPPSARSLDALPVLLGTLGYGIEPDPRQRREPGAVGLLIRRTRAGPPTAPRSGYRWKMRDPRA